VIEAGDILGSAAVVERAIREYEVEAAVSYCKRQLQRGGIHSLQLFI
jgi:hypothetical protein